MLLPPYTGPFGPDERRHLLRRTLFGVTKADLDFFQNKNLTQTVADLLALLPGATPDPPKRWVDAYLQNGDLNTPPGTTPCKKDAQGNVIQAYYQHAGPTGNANTTWVDRGPVNQFGTYLDWSVSAWWIGLMTHQPRSIREKMTLFLHNLIPVKVCSQSLFTYHYCKLIRDYALGNYKELVEKMVLEPIMLNYLNGNKSFYSSTETPNENFARELLELFTVGKPSATDGSSYSEDDVRAIAKVLSGWVIRSYDLSGNGHDWINAADDPDEYNNGTQPKRVLFLPHKHYQAGVTLSLYFGGGISMEKGTGGVVKGGSQTTLSTGGVTKGGDANTNNQPYIPPLTTPDEAGAKLRIRKLIDIIFSRDDVAKHIVRKLYRFFVYGFADADLCQPQQLGDTVESVIISPLAKTLKDNNYELRPVLIELFKSAHFFEQSQRGCLIKNPFDFVIGSLRSFEINNQVPQIFDADGTTLNLARIDNSKCLARYRFYSLMGAVTQQTGFHLFNPPNVAGAPAYHMAFIYHRDWITSAVYLNERRKFLNTWIYNSAQYGHSKITRLMPNDKWKIDNSGFDTTSTSQTIPPRLDDFIFKTDFLGITRRLVGTNADISFDAFINTIFDHFLAIRPMLDATKLGVVKTLLAFSHWGDANEADTWAYYLANYTNPSAGPFQFGTKLRTFYWEYVLNTPDYHLM
jgi:uncharacterized protein (DUF1800 family)